MTYWARVDRDGPWFESDVLVGASTVEVRPLVESVPTRIIAFSAIDEVVDLGPGEDPLQRHLAVRGTDGGEVELRGSTQGAQSLLTALSAARADVPETTALATAAVAPEPGPSEPGPSEQGPPDRRGSGRIYPVAVVATLAFIVALGFWNHASNQQELNEIAAKDGSSSTTTGDRSSEGRSTEARPSDDATTSSASTTSTTTTTAPPVTVLGASTVPSTEAPPTTVAPPPTTARPTTTRPPAAAPAGARLLTGTVALRQAQRWEAEPPECRGVGALADVGVGTPVVVRAGSGNVIAEGALGGCRFVVPGTELAGGAPAVQTDGAAGGMPQFSLEIPDVADSDRYTVQVGRYDPVGFSRQEIGPGTWRMRMVISAR